MYVIPGLLRVRYTMLYLLGAQRREKGDTNSKVSNSHFESPGWWYFTYNPSKPYINHPSWIRRSITVVYGIYNDKSTCNSKEARDSRSMMINLIIIWLASQKFWVNTASIKFGVSKLHTQGDETRVPQGCIATRTVLGPEKKRFQLRSKMRQNSGELIIKPWPELFRPFWVGFHY